MKQLTEYHCEACHQLLRLDDSPYAYGVSFDGKRFFHCACGYDHETTIKVRKDVINLLEIDDLDADARISMEIFVEALMLWIERANNARDARQVIAAKHVERVKAFSSLHGIHRYAYETDGLGESDYDRNKRDAMMLPLTLTEVEVEERYGAKTIPGGCDNGTVRVMSDVWESCTGCASCHRIDSVWSSYCNSGRNDMNGKGLRAAWSLGRMVWLAARVEISLPYARANDAFAALGRIGQAIAAALAPGLAIATMLQNAIVCWNTVAEGCWYRVSGGRGTAAKCKGFEGQLTRLYKNDYGTLRAKLVDASGTAHTVAATQLERLAGPAAAALAETPKQKADTARAAYLARPVYSGRVGRNGDVGCVHSGPHAGKSGIVFWQAADKSRVGLKSCSCTRRCDHEPMWCNAGDVFVQGATTKLAA